MNSTPACHYSNCCEFYPQIHHLSATVISHFSHFFLKQDGYLRASIWDQQLRRGTFLQLWRPKLLVFHHELRSIFPSFTFYLVSLDPAESSNHWPFSEAARGWATPDNLASVCRHELLMQNGSRCVCWSISATENKITRILVIHLLKFEFISLTDCVGSYILACCV